MQEGAAEVDAYFEPSVHGGDDEAAVADLCVRRFWAWA